MTLVNRPRTLVSRIKQTTNHLKGITVMDKFITGFFYTTTCVATLVLFILYVVNPIVFVVSDVWDSYAPKSTITTISKSGKTYKMLVCDTDDVAGKKEITDTDFNLLLALAKQQKDLGGCSYEVRT